MSKIRILPYKAGSKSAKALAESLGAKVLRVEGSRWKPRVGDAIINWGSSDKEHPCLFYDGTTLINDPDFVGCAANKLTTFQVFKANDVETVPWSTDIKTAKEWLQNGRMVVCRQKLTGHSGDGIVLATTEEELVRAPLYTSYVKKKEEFRVHVVGGEVIFQQRKARALEVPDEEINWQVRNLKGGFIYANKDIEVGEEGRALAKLAVSSLRLDFGAVDLLQTAKGKFFVLEVNTACGLEGSTIDAYSSAFKRMLNE